MLNRRILRVKVFKTIYCYAENHGMTLGEAEALLDRSCESTRDLYLFLLAVAFFLCRIRILLTHFIASLYWQL